MCGILGLYRIEGGSVDISALVAGTAVQRHRGPDDEGYVLVDSRRGEAVACTGDDSDPRVRLPHVSRFAGERRFDVCLGFRRLAIHDLSPAGHQPMASRDGRLWIVFNGEIYNFRDLRAELESHGYRFETDSDTEVILAAYDKWGEECLRFFNGMWAFAIWDIQKRELFIARDRFGEKPLHYTHSSGLFAFSSEMKGLWAAGAADPKIDDEGLARYRLCGETDASEQTLFSGVRRLLQSHSLRVTPAGLLPVRRYWDLHPHATRDQSEAQSIERFRELCVDSVNLRLSADVPVGSSLSGGLDSSTVVSIIASLLPPQSTQKTFSARFSEQQLDEGKWMNLVIEAAGRIQPHFVFPDREGFLSSLQTVFWHQEEPFVSSSIYAQWCVMRLAKDHGVTVLLDGQGADEILGGYHSYLEPAGHDFLRRWDYSGFARWRDACWTLHGRRVGSLTSWVGGNLLTAVKRPVKAVVAPWRARPFDPSRPIYPSHVRHLSEFRKLLWWNTTRSGLCELLRYADRNSMAHGREVRLPFLDHRLVEFAFSLPDDLLMRLGWTKWILRHAFTDIVPPAISQRVDKIAYNTPQGQWLGDRAWSDVMMQELRKIPQIVALTNGARTALTAR